MVECEYIKRINTRTGSESFNRYMVECEYRKLTSYGFTYIVLIDTWWNVNSSSVFQNFYAGEVLIDTWWNVNVSKPVRYYTFDVVLIDTWWNVNIIMLVVPVSASGF